MFSSKPGRVITAGIAGIVIGGGAFGVVACSSSSSSSSSATASSSPEVSQGPGSAGRELVIKLVVKSEPCWVEFTSLAGAYLTQVTLPVGATKTWTFSRAVDMQLGNPGAVVLTVNGKDRGSPGSPGTPITLSFHPGKQLTS